MIEQDSPGESFWKKFVSETWEKKTTHLHFPLQISEDDLFAGMLQAAELEREGWPPNFNDPYRVALDGFQVLDTDTFSVFLPSDEDGDMNGYIQRIEGLCDLDIGVQVTKISRFSPVIWQRVRHFLQPFFAAANVIPEIIEIDLFMGRYSQTHFGVHLDAESTFTFGFRGEKNFRMWPLETFTPEMAVEGWPTNIQDEYYHKFRDDAEVVSTHEGQLLYWPSSVWHLGESPDSWSITLAVALHLKPDPYERVKAVMSQLLPNPPRAVDANAYPCDISNRSEQAPPLAANLAAALADIRRAVDEEAIDLHLCLDWLKQVSGCGLTATPPPRVVQNLRNDQELRIDGRYPIQWRFFPGNKAVIAANGYGDIFEMDQSEALASILTKLNQGESVRPSEVGPYPKCVLLELARWHVFV